MTQVKEREHLICTYREYLYWDSMTTTRMLNLLSDNPTTRLKGKPFPSKLISDRQLITLPPTEWSEENKGRIRAVSASILAHELRLMNTVL